MKFFSSSSSTASTTTLCDGNPRNSFPRYISSFFRWLLCFKSLPRYSADHSKEYDINSTDCEKLKSVEQEIKVHACSATPGIVARLMGLEPMQENDRSVSISRSLSMNSVVSLREVMSMQAMRHGRSKSFRESPTFIELEDDDHFLILSFENGGQTKDFRSKSRQLETGSGVSKQRRADKCKKRINNNRRASKYEEANKENQDIIKSSNGKTNMVVSQKPSPRVGSNILCPF